MLRFDQRYCRQPPDAAISQQLLLQVRDVLCYLLKEKRTKMSGKMILLSAMIVFISLRESSSPVSTHFYIRRPDR